MKDIRQLYENNWSTMTGLQMSEESADYGYTIVNQLPKGKCLDIGCGDGTNALRLQKLGFEAEGSDISQNAVNKCLKRGIKAKRVDMNVPKLPYASNYYSLIWMSDVIEHVFWPESVLSEVWRMLVKGGHVYITTPNVAWWGIRLQIMAGKTLRDIHPEHIHWFNNTQLIRLIEKSKLSVISNAGYNRLMPYPVVTRLPYLKKFNSVGKMNSLLSYTMCLLARK